MVQGGTERRPAIWNGLRNIMKTSNNVLKIFFEGIFFGLYFYTLLKKTLAQVFSCEFYEIFKSTLSTEDHRATACTNRLEILNELKLSSHVPEVIFKNYCLNTPFFIENLRWLLLFATI